MPPLSENVPTSTLGIKTPKNIFGTFYSGYMWLKDRSEDDGAEGLWRIHDDLYDLTDFIKNHPGGPEWLQLTKGTDITEAFEVHHLGPKPEQLLPKFHVRKATEKRNAPFTFEQNGFYRTLKRNVREVLPTLNTKPARISDLMTDAVFLGTYVFAILFARYWNYALILLSGFCLGCTTIASHNYLHRRDNFRMYYFNLCGWHYREFRISHALSHHLHTNTIDDMEVSGFEPFFQYLPRERKSFLVRYGSWVYSPLLWMTNFPIILVRRFLSYALGNTETMVWSDLVPFSLPIAIYVLGGQPFLTSMGIWLCVLILASTHFFFVGLNAAHHHPDVFHDGDTPRPPHEMDWGIAELDAVVDRYDITGSHWLVLTNFGDHALHHLFPTLDHGVLCQLYPVFEKTMKEFNLNLRFASQLTCIKGNLKQLCNQGRNQNPPDLFKKIT